MRGTEWERGKEQMAEMQKIIEAEKSDLFDVLVHVAYALPTMTREERRTGSGETAPLALAQISRHCRPRQSR
jgi:type I restriction enzyme R subunit